MALWNRLTVLYVPLCCMRLRLHIEWPHIEWLRNREERAASAQSHTAFHQHCGLAQRGASSQFVESAHFHDVIKGKCRGHPCPFALMPALP